MNTKEVKKLKLKFFIVSSLIIISILLVTAFIMPIILNYPPYSETNFDFQNDVEPFNHPQQYIFMFILIDCIFTLIMNLLMKNIYSFLNKYYSKKDITNTEIQQIRKDCINIPYIFYTCEIIISLIIGIFLPVALQLSTIIIIKYALLLLALFTLISLLQFMFLQTNLKKIISLTYDINPKFQRNVGIRLQFSTSLIIQIIPFLLAATIIISLVGYSKAIKEKENGIIDYYTLYMNNCNFDTITLSALKSELDKVPLYNYSDYYLIISPDRSNTYVSKSNVEVTNFFLKYLEYFFYDTNGIIYEYYGSEQQAYMIELIDENGASWYVGFEFLTSDYDLMLFYVRIILGVLILYLIFLYIWSKNTSTNISTISQSLEHVIEENDYSSRKILPILSNDEFGDLAYSYNKIEELTSQHLRKIQNNQDMLIEQERLASLGQMIGGIAHNLKTPIFSVAGGLEGLSDLINEYDASIDNSSVTNEDMHEIAGDMREWVEKLRGHISYMSDVITTVKGQTVTLADNESIEFSVTELFKRIDILMKHEVKNALATLKIQNNVGDSDLLTGNINSLVQIINNIISNSIEAYGNNYTDKIIELTANRDSSNLIISIKDYGPGISEIAQAKLFKEMITTKGKNGTGLGMFMSYSNIRAHFNGNLSYETEIRQRYHFLYYLANQKLTFQ